MKGDAMTLLEGISGSSGVSAARESKTLVAFELLTLGPDGWPHVAWLGPGEVMAVDPTCVAVAVWPGSSTRKNLESGTGVLQVVAEGLVHRIRLRFVELGPVPVGARALRGFIGTVSELITDKVAYAEVLSGLSYRLFDPETVLTRWEEQAQSLSEVVASHLFETHGI